MTYDTCGISTADRRISISCQGAVGASPAAQAGGIGAAAATRPAVAADVLLVILLAMPRPRELLGRLIGGPFLPAAGQQVPGFGQSPRGIRLSHLRLNTWLNEAFETMKTQEICEIWKLHSDLKLLEASKAKLSTHRLFCRCRKAPRKSCCRRF